MKVLFLHCRQSQVSLVLIFAKLILITLLLAHLPERLGLLRVLEIDAYFPLPVYLCVCVGGGGARARMCVPTPNIKIQIV